MPLELIGGDSRTARRLSGDDGPYRPQVDTATLLAEAIAAFAASLEPEECRLSEHQEALCPARTHRRSEGALLLPQIRARDEHVLGVCHASNVLRSNHRWVAARHGRRRQRYYRQRLMEEHSVG